MLRKLESWPDWQIALAIAASLRLFYSVAAAVVSLFLHPDAALIRSNALTDNLPAPGGWHYALLGIWERFDTLWYLHIAKYGYDRPASVVFYPLYPWMIRVLAPLVGGTGGALFVSTVAAWFFIWAMARLARMDSPGSPPFRVLALTTVWPASFFLFAGYTEALAAALVVWSILFARREGWIAACITSPRIDPGEGTRHHQGDPRSLRHEGIRPRPADLRVCRIQWTRQADRPGHGGLAADPRDPHGET